MWNAFRFRYCWTNTISESWFVLSIRGFLHWTVSLWQRRVLAWIEQSLNLQIIFDLLSIRSWNSTKTNLQIAIFYKAVSGLSNLQIYKLLFFTLELSFKSWNSTKTNLQIAFILQSCASAVPRAWLHACDEGGPPSAACPQACPIGPEANILEPSPEQCRRLWLEQPILSRKDMRVIKATSYKGWKVGGGRLLAGGAWQGGGDADGCYKVPHLGYFVIDVLRSLGLV